MTKSSAFQLPPAEKPLAKVVWARFSKEDYEKLKVLSRQRGEKGIATLVRRLTLAALEELRL